MEQVLEILLDGGIDDLGALVLEGILSQPDPSHRSLARKGRSFFCVNSTTPFCLFLGFVTQLCTEG